MKNKIKFNITDKEVQLLTVTILFLSLTISILGNLEQIKQNKIALYKQEEYTELSEYKKDFVLCSEGFLSLLERTMENNEASISKKLFEEDLNLSQKLQREGCVIDGFLEQYSIDEQKIRDLSDIMSFTFVVAKSKMKKDKTYQDCYIISKKDLADSLNRANDIVFKIREQNNINFKPKKNTTLEEYRSAYLPAIEDIHHQFDNILIKQFVN